ncbi:MAG: ABC-three component system protein [Romboutsia sp.]
MLGRSNINQNETSSSGQINQAGRDNNVNNYSFNFSISDIENITFYEDEIKDVIIFFNKCKDDISPPMYTDLKSIDIEDKNRKNKLSQTYFNEINEKSLPQFGKIRAFLKDPRNEEYVEMYENTVTDLQNIVLTHINSVDSFEKIITKLYQYVVDAQRDDKSFIKIRKKVLLFLHFMYYNCDIGIK